MSQKFQMIDEGVCTFYLGMNMKQTDETLNRVHDFGPSWCRLPPFFGLARPVSTSPSIPAPTIT